jgi:hypothetical protein
MDVCLRTRALSSLLAAVVLCAPLASQAGGQQVSVRREGGTRIGLHRAGSVNGTAWHPDNTPIARALLRLRDVTAGRALMRTRSDVAGRFLFEEVPAGSYLVELVDDDDRVLAVGPMFSMAQAEWVATFVRLGTNVPWYGGFFGNSAAAVLTTAAALGVTAVAQGGSPASPRH